MQYLILILLLCLPLGAAANTGEAEHQVPDLYASAPNKGDHHGASLDQLLLETRLAWEEQLLDGHQQDDASGFRGQFINLRFDATLVSGLRVSWRQRLNRQTNRTFWDATDWLKLDWQPSTHWVLSAGKLVVNEGGWEYDRPPIDLYFCSDHWYHINCYQLGVSATFKPSDRDALTLQVCNSPYRQWAGNNSYAVNFQWMGQHKWYHTSFGINAFQRDNKGHFIGLMSLGNRFFITKDLRLDVDYIHRATRNQAFFRDFTLSTELRGQVHPSTSIFAKYTYDQNKTGSNADREVLNGTQIQSTSLGIEVHPFRKYRDGMRFFAVAGYAWGDNPEPDGCLRDKQLSIQAGLKFKADILEGLKWTINKFSKQK